MHMKFKLSILIVALLTFAARTTLPVMAQVPTRRLTNNCYSFLLLACD